MIDYLQSDPAIVSAHDRCYRIFTSKRLFAQRSNSEGDLVSVSSGSKRKSLRSTGDGFCYRSHCFICGKEATIDSRYPKKCQGHSVSTTQVTDSMLNLCKLREDQWGFDVQARIETAGDLFAADAIYHRSCHREFSKIYETSGSKGLGRPVNLKQESMLDCLCDMLENCDSELYTVEDLRNKLKVIAGTDDVYSEKTILRKLKDRYGDHIFCTTICGRRNVLCFRDLASRIVNDTWYASRESDLTKDSERVVTAAANLLKAAIRETVYRVSEYPSTHELDDKQTED